jgi:alpha-beta hydrolase superfamily lysophospholipase
MPRPSWIAGLIAIALAALPIGAATADDAPYPVPSPLATAEHGTVISTKPLATAAALPGAARNLLVLYHSLGLDGRDIAVSGSIAIPAGTPPPGGWPVTSWAHGTTGLGAACAPSRDRPDGPEHAFLGPKQVLMDDYVKRGYVVVATDYQGLGGPGLHPFLQGVAAGRGVLDIVRAARAIDPAIGPRYVVIGHSQGGHADLFAAAIAADYVPELQLLGNAAMAPASHIAETVLAMTTAEQPSYALGYISYVLQSFASNHPAIDLTTILTPQARAQLPQTRTDCISKTVSQGFWATAIPRQQFLPDADLSAVLQVAAENEPGGLRIAAPTLVLQGTADDTVLPAWTDAVARGLCDRGSPLAYSIYPGATHETIVGAAAPLLKDFVDARFKGEPMQSNCATLPTAAGK